MSNSKEIFDKEYSKNKSKNTNSKFKLSNQDYKRLNKAVINFIKEVSKLFMKCKIFKIKGQIIYLLPSKAMKNLKYSKKIWWIRTNSSLVRINR